jgi:hypothetical protein
LPLTFRDKTLHIYPLFLHLILNRMRRRSKRLTVEGTGEEGGCVGEPPPSRGVGGRGGGSVGAARKRTSQGTAREAPLARRRGGRAPCFFCRRA